MIRGTVAVQVACAPPVLWHIVTDITQMGVWSPECTGGRWIPPHDGPTVGAMFEGTNASRFGPLPAKKWTTTSVVTRSRPLELFEFVTNDFTCWRYEFIEMDGCTRLTETFEHEPFAGQEHLRYNVVGNRYKTMLKSMQHTLDSIKRSVEAQLPAQTVSLGAD